MLPSRSEDTIIDSVEIVRLMAHIRALLALQARHCGTSCSLATVWGITGVETTRETRFWRQVG